MKDQTPKLLIQQKKDVDLYFRVMPDSKEWWVKVDIIKGRETDAPRFRVGRKGKEGKWENKWFIDIKDPSIWGRLTNEQKKEHLEKETRATTIGGEINLTHLNISSVPLLTTSWNFYSNTRALGTSYIFHTQFTSEEKRKKRLLN